MTIKATIRSATAKWQIIRLTLDRRWRRDRKSVMTTDKLPPAAMTNSTQYTIITAIVESVYPENNMQMKINHFHCVYLFSLALLEPASQSAICCLVFET